MTSLKTTLLLAVLLAAQWFVPTSAAGDLPQCDNLLVDAKLSSNLESFDAGLRGAVDQMIYDTARMVFTKPSTWHEYGVGFERDLGVVPEQRPAWWMAQWRKPVRANLIQLTGVHPNQPQPHTAWKIELRLNGVWRELDRGVGGWYDAGRYRWGGPDATPIDFDAIRISLFSSDSKTPLRSIHFRGEPGYSWVVAKLPAIAARLVPPPWPVRAGQPAAFSTVVLRGTPTVWQWDFGDGVKASGRRVTHTFRRPGRYQVRVDFRSADQRGFCTATISVRSPVNACITPLEAPVFAGRPLKLHSESSVAGATTSVWDFGDGQTASGKRVVHTFDRPGIYQVKLTLSDGTYSDDCWVIVRVHTEQTVRLPQVILDTDAKNEQDDQHYLGYALLSQVDVLGVNSVHHGGGQEPTNYAEILKVVELAESSGLPKSRRPLVFHGANQRLAVPASGHWSDTVPIVSAASEAILGAARGATPDNPVWVLPVGPGTNVASAILQARAEGLELADRIRVVWLGGGPKRVDGESFNGNNDPWSVYVIGQSGVPLEIVLENPTGASVRIDKQTEAELYPKNPLGAYLLDIVPIQARHKPLFDLTTVATVIAHQQRLDWLLQVQPATIAGPDQAYRWGKAGADAPVRIIRDIDEAAMKNDFFETLNGRPRRLVP